MTTAVSGTETAVDTKIRRKFNANDFKEAARAYAKHKRAIDAIAAEISRKDGCKDFADAVRVIGESWELLADMAARGGEYTPPTELGFGSSNGGQIASALMGDRASVTEVRKSFAAHGK